MLKKTLLAALVLGVTATAVQANEVSGYAAYSLGQTDSKGFNSDFSPPLKGDASCFTGCNLV